MAAAQPINLICSDCKADWSSAWVCCQRCRKGIPVKKQFDDAKSKAHPSADAKRGQNDKASIPDESAGRGETK